MQAVQKKRRRYENEEAKDWDAYDELLWDVKALLGAAGDEAACNTSLGGCCKEWRIRVLLSSLFQT